MPIVFEQPLENPLAPHHYVEFSNAEAFTGLTTLSQRLLLIDIDPKAHESVKGKVLSLAELGAHATAAVKTAVAAAKVAASNVKPQVLIVAKAADLAAALPEEPFTQIALLKDDTAALAQLKTLMESRAGPALQLDGQVFVASHDPANRARNGSPHITVIPLRHEEQDPADWAAAFAAVNAAYAIEPSRPYQTLKIAGLTCPDQGYKLAERDALLKQGVSTWRKDGEDIIIDRLVTCYTNDPSYRDLNTKQTLAFLRHDFRTHIARRFPRHMLAKDDFPYEGPVITPKTAMVEALSRYRLWQRYNLVQDPDGQFAKKLRVEVDEKTPGKLNFLLPVYLMGQWRVTQTCIAFKV